MNPTIDDIKVTTFENKGNFKGEAYEVALHDIYQTNFLILMHRKKGLKTEKAFYKGTLEHHKAQEVILVDGKMKLFFEDLTSNKKEVILEKGQKLSILPYILHSYEILENSIFIETKVHAFDPKDADKYSVEEFNKLKK